MSRNILIFDTTLLCCWLNVPGMSPVQSKSEIWTSERVDVLLKSSLASGATVILPLATIIETGNHISQATSEIFKHATNFATYLKKCANESDDQWAAFVQVSEPWNTTGLLRLAEEWPKDAKAKFSISDWTIRHVADYYSQAGYAVTILTADTTLKSYEPKRPERIPRKRL